MEPWEIKIDDSRKVNSKKVFIIFCEDGGVEPAYFELFKREDVQVSAFANKKQHHAQVDYATEHCRKNDLLETNKSGKEILKIDEGTQVWCVFDRDKEPNDEKDTAFNDSIYNANSKGIRTAWSNDNFELWILLHFEDVNPENTDYANRIKYYERLTEILKRLLSHEKDFQHPRFDYRISMKSKNKFIQFTYQLMKDKLDNAIERAIKLEKYHSAVNKPTHLYCPCTKVHHLVKELTSR